MRCFSFFLRIAENGAVVVVVVVVVVVIAVIAPVVTGTSCLQLRPTTVS